MTCPTCGREYQSESGGCSFCTPPLFLQRQTEKLAESRMNIAPKSIGICPDCGMEQVGTVHRISRVVADFLKPKYADFFVPDKHQCLKKVAAG